MIKPPNFKTGFILKISMHYVKENNKSYIYACLKGLEDETLLPFYVVAAVHLPSSCGRGENWAIA